MATVDLIVTYGNPEFSFVEAEIEVPANDSLTVVYDQNEGLDNGSGSGFDGQYSLPLGSGQLLYDWGFTLLGADAQDLFFREARYELASGNPAHNKLVMVIENHHSTNDVSFKLQLNFIRLT